MSLPGMFGTNECFQPSCKPRSGPMREVRYKQKLRNRHGALAENTRKGYLAFLQGSIWERKCEAKKLLSRSCSATHGCSGWQFPRVNNHNPVLRQGTLCWASGGSRQPVGFGRPALAAGLRAPTAGLKGRCRSQGQQGAHRLGRNLPWGWKEPRQRD